MDFFNVELFRTGRWNNKEFSLEDIDGIVRAYHESKGEVAIPIKIGHNEKQRFLNDDMPAAGWVENVRRSGDRIIADFKHVPATVAELIRNGAYRGRSVELYPDYKLGEKTYKYFLTGVALLGSALPAVSGLQDIVKLYQNEEITYDKLAEIVVFETHTEEERKEPKKVDLVKMAKLLGLPDDATEEQIEAKVNELKTPAPPQQEDNTELFKANERIIALEKEVAKSKAETQVEAAIRSGKLLPKQKDFAIKMALQDVESFTQFVESQPDNMIEFGERGAPENSNTVNFAKYEPTEAEISTAKQMGIWSNDWRISMMKFKANQEGVTIPDDFEKTPA